MPRASQAINRFLIFSPSVSWVSVTDGWCDRGRRLHKSWFWILNQRAGSRALGAGPPSFGSHCFMGTLWSSLALLEIQPPRAPVNGQRGHMASHQSGDSSLWIPNSQEVWFRKPRSHRGGRKSWQCCRVLGSQHSPEVKGVSPSWGDWVPVSEAAF